MDVVFAYIRMLLFPCFDNRKIVLYIFPKFKSWCGLLSGIRPFSKWAMHAGAFAYGTGIGAWPTLAIHYEIGGGCPRHIHTHTRVVFCWRYNMAELMAFCRSSTGVQLVGRVKFKQGTPPYLVM
jgi:hypothetical protein